MASTRSARAGRRTVEPKAREAATPSEAPGSRPQEPQALTTTFAFDAGPGDEPYAVTVRFTGRRLDATGRRDPGDSFVREENVANVVPGSGPVSVTTRAQGINAGEWSVGAEIVAVRGPGRPTGLDGAGKSRRLAAATWSWRRWRLSPQGPTERRASRWAPLAALDRMPAVVPGSWSGLVALGVVVGVVIQALLLGREGLPVGRVLLVSLLALVVGLVGAKLWYVALNPRTWMRSPAEGWCIQGFLVGVAVVVAGAVALLSLPAGEVLDASAPGLFVGLTIGRLGCFLTGCCAGRTSRSRWTLWSSDRRVGSRRLPTQLMESGSALVIAAATLAIVLVTDPHPAGMVFVGAFAAYTLVRQALLRLRAEPRRSRFGLPLTAAAATLVVVVAALVAALF